MRLPEDYFPVFKSRLEAMALEAMSEWLQQDDCQKNFELVVSR